MAQNTHQDPEQQSAAMQRYYAWQSRIYDATRWSFLFGRKQIIDSLPFDADSRFTLLEVGCGTGYNLLRLAKSYARAELIGLDASSHMAKIARKQLAPFSGRISIQNRPYLFGESDYNEQMDVILFSYSLTMINPQWRDLILQAKRDLKPGGIIAVADFYDSSQPWFKRHMGNHHVRMDGHLTPLLQAEFESVFLEVNNAYGGIWQYFMYQGKKTS
jgi:S-adenosylmethionine-diacylgycerolhomoserine-N-methlytransferase